MASTASLSQHSSAPPPPAPSQLPSSQQPGGAIGRDASSPVSAAEAAASAAAFHHRMDQFLSLRQQQQQQQKRHDEEDEEDEEEEAAASSSEHLQQRLAAAAAAEDFRRHSPNNAVERIGDTSATSGSNSGDEDERELGEIGIKRLGGHFNGLSSKKRRKQSKPLRLGSDLVPSAAAAAEGGSRMGGSPGASPEPGEFNRYRRYSTEEEELEEGERRPSDGPLNLSSGGGGDGSSGGREEGERPSLRILGPELMHHAVAAGFMSPEDLAKSGGAGGLHIPSSMYQGMLPFGLSPFPFPFPSQPHSPYGKMPGSNSAGGSGSGANSGSGGRIQIFNPEAYCGLCNKEFCNKYFLKTHKANKHGIYSDGPGGRGSPTGPNMPPSSASSNASSGGGAGGGGPTPPSAASGPLMPADQVGPPTPTSQAGSPFSGAFIAANMGALRPPFLPLSPGASPSPNSSQAQQQQQSGSGGGGSSHQQQPNGDSGGREEEEGLLHHQSMRPNSHSGLMSPREAGEVRGGKENDDLRRSLESPRNNNSLGLPPHLSSFNPLMFGGIPSLESLRKEEEKRLEAGQQRSMPPHIPNIPNVPIPQGGSGSSSSGSIPKGPFTPDKLRQMGVINADAFCEICCKEFCNKYFLRVHKLKKHGICSPDLPPEKVQKILNQMAKEAGKTGNPPPPIIRPPSHAAASGSGAPRSSGSSTPGVDSLSMSFGNSILPPHLRAPGAINLGSSMMQFPPLEPLLPQALKDFPPLPNMPTAPLPMSAATASSKSSSSPSAHTPSKEQLNHQKSSPSSSTEVIRINDDSEDGVIHRDHDHSKSSRASPSASAAAASEDLQRLQSMILELNNSKGGLGGGPLQQLQGGHHNNSGDSSTLCKICNKDMENKYFLRAHMMNEHGVLHVEESTQQQLDKDEKMNGGNNSNGGDASAAAAAAAAADFASKFLQQMQKGLGAASLSFDGEELSFLERVKSELSGCNAKKQQQLDKDPNRKPASLSRSYCEICKKELCNKYFMKTHMMKMHGINIEATNQNGVSCQLCGKELCSKYFLKVHLQNSHGINEDGSPAARPVSGENGSGGGGGLFAGLFPPPPEMLGLPGSPDKDRYFSRLLGEQSEISRERLKELERQKQMLGGGGGVNSDSPHSCSLCGEDFPEIVALQVHIIKSHGAFPPESGVFGSSLEASPRPKSQQSGRSDEDDDDEGRLAGGDRRRRGGEDNSKTDDEDDGRADSPESEEKYRRRRRQQQQQQQQLMSTPNASSISSGGAFGFPGLDGLVIPTTTASEAAKQFPHIEMLQRHMLSTQFPGLINPLLSGFPGFPGMGGGGGGGGGGGLHFPNPLQHLMSPHNSQGGIKQERTPPSQTTSLAKGPRHSSEKKSSGKKTRRFKCSKCHEKFPRRESCLRHIHKAHSSPSFSARNSSRRTSRLFSPAKRTGAARSNYVRQLMELLRVPTTRGTPHSPKDGETTTTMGRHIMQPFLLQAPPPPSPPLTPESTAADGTTTTSTPSSIAAEINFVPSLVYLPVARRVSHPMTVAFSLTPA